MLLMGLLALFLLMLLSSVSQAELYQINTSRTLCTREKAVFICSNNDGPVIRCIVTTVTGVRVSIALHGKFNKMQEKTADSTLLRGEVIDVNSTYFVATITLVPPLSSTIVCNAETISYQLQNNSQLIPAQLNLTLQENTSDYIITWTPDWSNSTHYIVTVTPNSPDETTETITSTASATLSLNKTVTYNITISFMECPDLYNMTFVLTPRPRLQVSFFFQTAVIDILNDVSHTMDMIKRYNTPIIITGIKASFNIVLASTLTSVVIALFMALIITAIILVAVSRKSFTCRNKKIVLKNETSARKHECEDLVYQHLGHRHHSAGEVNSALPRQNEPEYSTLNECTPMRCGSLKNSKLQLKQDLDFNQYSTLNINRAILGSTDEAATYCTIGALSTEENKLNTIGNAIVSDGHFRLDSVQHLEGQVSMKLSEQPTDMSTDMSMEHNQSPSPPPVPPQQADIMDGLDVALESYKCSEIAALNKPSLSSEFGACVLGKLP